MMKCSFTVQGQYCSKAGLLRSTFHVSQLTTCVFRALPALGLTLSLPLAAAEIDESKLVAPATTKIEFERDIKPIFEKACLRCHGSEKPKGKFRLDNKEDALKGGENGVDILPGQSAK